MAAALSRVYAGLCRRDRLTSKECPFWFYSLFCDPGLGNITIHHINAPGLCLRDHHKNNQSNHTQRSFTVLMYQFSLNVQTFVSLIPFYNLYITSIITVFLHYKSSFTNIITVHASHNIIH
jgi:hypothetical protein